MANDLARRLGEKSWEWWVHAGEIQQESFGHGRWDEALVLSADVLAETAAVGGHYMDPSMRMMRALIFAARAEDDAARFELERGLESINPSGGTQAVAPILNEGAQVCLLLGDDDRAAELMAGVLRAVREGRTKAPGIDADGAAAVWRIGYAEEWLEIADGFAEAGRVWAARLVISGRAADAVALYEQIGSPREAAGAAWTAAEQLVADGRVTEGQPFLEQALSYYRAAGATRIVRRAQALLAAAS
jgi:hypothetical protein